MKVGVVLFNLGGPDTLDAVRPYLRNLFSDPAIIRVPQPLRWLLAWLISSRRAPVARAIYEKLGGRSPILPNTEDQAKQLTEVLQGEGIDGCVVLAMRYWHPFAAEAVAALKAQQVDRIVLLPLYPQFSTATTESSVQDWIQAARKAGLDVPVHTVCCYPSDGGLVSAHAGLLRKMLEAAGDPADLRILFSAHGLPESVIRGGDPYQWQVEQTAAAVMARLGHGQWDWVISYQSRVGPLKWIGPSTEEEIRRAGRERKGLVIVPVAFVSEHSETLVELDLEGRELAHDVGVPRYYRVPALGVQGDFIKGLAGLVRSALERGPGCQSGPGHRLCPAQFRRCAMTVVSE